MVAGTLFHRHTARVSGSQYPRCDQQYALAVLVQRSDRSIFALYSPMTRDEGLGSDHLGFDLCILFA
jgi:hypothetical protein